jgi:hypothetical protein
MRRLLLLLCTAALACGGSDSDGGGGPRGTVGGRAFAASEARAVGGATAATPCTVPNPVGAGTIEIGITGLKIDIASYAGICGDYATAQCQLHANGQTVTLLFARLNPLPPYTAPALAPGSYTIQPSPTIALPDGTGLLTVVYAQALATGVAPGCEGFPSPAVQGGTLRLDRVSEDVVTGAVSVTFTDGSAVQGDFTAATCGGVSFDICPIAATQEFCELPPQCR